MRIRLRNTARKVGFSAAETREPCTRSCTRPRTPTWSPPSPRSSSPLSAWTAYPESPGHRSVGAETFIEVVVSGRNARGVTKKCRLSLLTNSALYTSPNARIWGGGWGGCGVSANEYSCAHHFGDLPPYLTYEECSFSVQLTAKTKWNCGYKNCLLLWSIFLQHFAIIE